MSSSGQTMNWCRMFSTGLVKQGSEIEFVIDGCCINVCVVKQDGKIADKKTGEVFARPSQLWSKHSRARKKSWWDVCMINGQSLRSIKNGGFALRSPSSRAVSLPKKTCLQMTPVPPQKRLKRLPYQTRITRRGNPHSRTKRSLQPTDAGASQNAPRALIPRFWTPVTANVDSRIDFVRKYFGSHILSYDSDEKGFTCKCGQHLSLTNPNFEKNIRDHYGKNKKCLALRKTGVTVITRFFAPVQKYARPDPQIFCHGIWQEYVLIDGVECRTALLGEHSNSLLYYVSGKPTLLTGTFGTVRTATRSIFSVDCLTHALDQHNRIRKPKLCLKCSDLLLNPAFRKLLKDAQDPMRFNPSSRTPTQYLSWSHLQEQKREARKQKMLLNWQEHNRKRAADRRMARRLEKATDNLVAGELYVQSTHVMYVRLPFSDVQSTPTRSRTPHSGTKF